MHNLILETLTKISPWFQPNGSESFVMASAFHVKYILEKSGFYDINIHCGNILLNEGHSFRKEVKAGTMMHEMIKKKMIS